MSRPHSFKVLCAAIYTSGGFFSLPVMADELPTVVVSATRSAQSSLTTPAAITVITREEILASGATQLSEVLRGRAGVQITDFFGDASVVSIGMRGFAENSNSNTLVLVDGRRLNYSDTRAPDLSYVSLQDVERVEIVKGSAGVLFGDQAVGGVINIITRKPEKAGAEVDMSVGSYSRTALGVYHSNMLDNGVNYKLSLSGYDTDNYRDHNEHSNVNANAYAGYDYDSGTVFAELQKVEDDLQTPGALIYSELVADRQQINAGFINDFTNTDTNVQRLGIRHAFSDRWSFEGELTNRDIDQDVRQSYRDYPSPETGASSRDLVSFNPRLIGVLPVDHGSLLLTMGVDDERSEYSLRLPYDSAFGPGEVEQSNDQDMTSVYAQAVYPVSPSVTATFGVRNAEVENDISDTSSYNFAPVAMSVDDSVTVSELGLRYAIDTQRAIAIRRDENFRFAKFNEFILASPGDELETQEGVSWELSYSSQDKRNDYEIQFYTMDLENEFFFDPTIGLFGANVNLDETLHKGVLIDYSHSFSKTHYIAFSYTYTDAKFKSGGLSGNTISGIADNQLGVRYGQSWSDTWRGYMELVAYSDKYVQGDNLNVLPKESGYAVTNASIAYKTDDYTVTAKINNLLDREYSEYVVDNFVRAYQPSPERNFLLTASVKF